MTETAKEAAWRLAQRVIAEGFKPEALHEYRTAAGEPIYWRIRAKHQDGRKWMRPMRLNGHGYELREPSFPASGKPLYRLDAIAGDPGEAVWIVEGEKAADALAKVGTIATTSGGADSADAADWSPLKGRTCVLWPDNDDPGRVYVGQVAAKLLALGCAVSCVDIARLELPPKGDAADWLAKYPNAVRTDVEKLSTIAAGSASGNELASVELVRADQIVMRPIDWLWRDYLAAGKLHILAGKAGTGKTTLGLTLAATITIGGRWPDGTHAETGDVLIWSGEDDREDTLVPRLKAAGADLSRVHFARCTRTERGDSRAFNPASDFPLLSLQVSRTPGIRLLMLDPVVSVVGAADSHHNAEVRLALQPLADFAERHRCGVLGVTHFTKGTAGSDPLERVTGSLAFGAAPRIVLAAAKVPEDQGGGIVVVRAKSNIGPDGGGFGFELQRAEVASGITGQRVLWKHAVAGSAREILGMAETDPDDDERNAIADAEDFLRDELSTGDVPAKEIQRRARAAGHADRTLKRAKARLGIRSIKAGLRDGWSWSLPPKSAKNAEECLHSMEASFAESGTLRPDDAPATEDF